MEMEYSQYITWLTHSAPPSDSTSQWGHSIKIVGDPRKPSGSKAKSFIADMFGFASNGELASVTNYLKIHGGFKLEQVSIYQVDCVWCLYPSDWLHTVF